MTPYRRPQLSFVLLLAACPAGKGTATAGEAGTTGTTVAAATDIGTTGTTASSATAVTEGVATQDTDHCEPVPCDCPDGCTPHQVCDGSQASCQCDCEDVSSSGGESTSTPGTSTSATTTGDTTSATSSDTSSGTTSDTTSDTTSGTTGEPAIACGGDDPYFPEFDRICGEMADCVLVFHQLDCCGSLAALGIDADAAELFAEAEAECVTQYPQCDCAPQPTVADDGSNTPDNGLIAVTCLNGLCLSFVP